MVLTHFQLGSMMTSSRGFAIMLHRIVISLRHRVQIDKWTLYRAFSVNTGGMSYTYIPNFLVMFCFIVGGYHIIGHDNVRVWVEATPSRDKAISQRDLAGQFGGLDSRFVLIISAVVLPEWLLSR